MAWRHLTSPPPHPRRQHYHPQRHGPAKAFYDNSIMYLSYTPLETLSTDTKYNLAHDMALAALVGDGV